MNFYWRFRSVVLTRRTKRCRAISTLSSIRKSFDTYVSAIFSLWYPIEPLKLRTSNNAPDPGEGNKNSFLPLTSGITCVYRDNRFVRTYLDELVAGGFVVPVFRHFPVGQRTTGDQRKHGSAPTPTAGVCNGTTTCCLRRLNMAAAAVGTQNAVYFCTSGRMPATYVRG